MIKAVFFDIDGTLVPLGKDFIPESTKDAIHKLQEKGIKLFIASGRPRAHLNILCQDFQDIAWDGYVIFNGQYCMDEKMNVFHKGTIDKDSFRTLIPWIMENRIPCMIMEEDYTYTNIDFKEAGLNRDMPVDDPMRAMTHDTYQMGAFIPEEMDDEFVSHASGIKSARWTPMFADIIPKDGGKPEGIMRMLKRHGLKQEECMAFGDGGNDISMLEFASIGVAMGNANDSVKFHADYVTSHIEEDGIANALKHFGIID